MREERGTGKREGKTTLWLKLWLDDWLDGDIRTELSPAERGCYCDLLVLAKKMCPSGLLASPGGQPYSQRWLAARLNIPITVLRSTVRVLVRLNRLVDSAQGLALVDYEKSQANYSRHALSRNGAPRAGRPAHQPVDYLQGKYGHMVQH